jgi:hypothetical protein
MANDFSGDSNCLCDFPFEDADIVDDALDKQGDLTDMNTVTHDTAEYWQGACSAYLDDGNNEYFKLTQANMSSDFPLKHGASDTTLSFTGLYRFDDATANQIFVSAGASNGGAYVYLASDKVSFRVYDSNDDYDTADHASALSDDTWYLIALTYDMSDNSYRIRIINVETQSVVGTDKTGTFSKTLHAGANDLLIGNTWNTDYNLDATQWFKDILTTDEIDQIAAGTFGGAETTSYTLDASYGSITFTGQSAALICDRYLPAEYGGFTFSGQDATLKKGYNLVSAYGDFNISGQTATLQHDRILSAAYGDFTLAGQDVDLSKGYILSADYGDFILSGQDVAFLIAYKLISDYGSFNLSGQDSTLAWGRVLSAAYGDYSLSGQDASLRKGYSMGAEYGSYSLSGQDADLLAARILSAAYGSYSLSGQDADLLKGYILAAEYGNFSHTGQLADLLAARLIEAGLASYVLSGQDATLTYTPSGTISYTVSASYGDFTLSGQDVDLTVNRKLVADTGYYTLSGQDVTMLLTRVLIAERGLYLLAGQEAWAALSIYPHTHIGDIFKTGFRLKSNKAHRIGY